jgi:hypothetical protein
MKTITFSALLLLATISFSSFVLSSNVKPASVKTVDSFRIHRQGKEIALIWSASGAADHFKVERSEDGEFFNTIDNVGANGARSYKYNDGSYFPGMIYYRITCVNSDGSEECSAVQSIRIVQRG